MAGHSKWHNIRLKKGKMDAERGKAFTRVTREIIVAARTGGGDPESNVRLRNAMLKAREVNMPADNVKRAIQRGTGELEGVTYEEVSYEGYGPGGAAVYIEAMTDNRNRTLPEIRNIFSRTGGNLGESGCVAWMFDNKGLIQIDAQDIDEDELLMATLDAGAEDIKNDDGVLEIVTAPENLDAVRAAVEEAGCKPAFSEVTMIPQNTIALAGKEAQQMLRLMDMLEEHDDIQKVHSNFDIPENILEQIG
ncbi:MAG: YebC/PmpR family DNA-binding transcriptional regulator [bacterium]|jgi:YebC/PmpR family DNA-binding regulatory protein|nr:YebC/PmpR family DNA-binding transcriptional regulator [bacterium]MDD3804982.1 YebC/PmpR family DNA-binding transcriptional regulator [bacterium]MDD4152904.1 YebC/PmpR family DNA-binding transcriptional regulator [bacterium]MDD4558769.1 YebC/PmpR family DNA-binding transcriptional regulator [bacterium]